MGIATVEGAVDYGLGTVTAVSVPGVQAGTEPDVRSDTPDAAVEAATEGLEVLSLVATDRLSAHTDRVREENIGFEAVDADATGE